MPSMAQIEKFIRCWADNEYSTDRMKICHIAGEALYFIEIDSIEEVRSKTSSTAQKSIINRRGIASWRYIDIKISRDVRR